MAALVTGETDFLFATGPVASIKAKNIRDFMPREALNAVASSPEELAANFKREIDRYAKIIKAGNIRLE